MCYEMQDCVGINEDLYIRAIGCEVVKWAKNVDTPLLARQVNTDAVLLLKEIQSILDDETLDDPECFYRIDAIVSSFHRMGLSTTRHWELE